MNVELLDNEGKEIDLAALAKDAEREERKINSSIRAVTGEVGVEKDELTMVVDPTSPVEY